MQYQNLRSTKLNGVFVCLKRVNEKEVMIMPKTSRIPSALLKASNVESLKTDTLRMSAETLNFWLCKFVQKVRLPYDLLRINILFAVVVTLFLIMSYILRSCR